MTLIQAELRRSGFEDIIAAGIVLTGGSSKMEGLIELAEEVFHAPVRLGVPQNVAGLSEVVCNPIYATGVGLLIFGQEHTRDQRNDPHFGTGMHNIWERMKSWFQGNF
jgi:cell division protein FtsA